MTVFGVLSVKLGLGTGHTARHRACLPYHFDYHHQFIVILVFLFKPW